MKSGKVLIVTAPSGAGKTTIVRHLVEEFDGLSFSVSATTRNPRGTEAHGVDYYFLPDDKFREMIDDNAFVEWEEVYEGQCYGTLLSEVENAWKSGKTIVFDVDVKGAIELKKYFGDNALALFIMPPSYSELKKRLITRSTENEEQLAKRLQRVEMEISKSGEFDVIIVNDRLEDALNAAKDHLKEFLG